MTKTNPSYEEVIDAQTQMFAAVNAMTEMTAIGANKALIIAGAPGCGKTFGVTKILKEKRDRGEITFSTIRGFTRPTGIYKELYLNRFENQVLLIDDCDSALKDEVSLNLLKVALDTSDERVISWRSNGNMVVETADGIKEQVPNSFEYNGMVIFLSNLNFDKLIEKGNAIAPHLEAIISRCHYIDLNINTNYEKLCRVTYVSYEQQMLQKQYCLSDEKAVEVMQFMSKNMNNLREISIRMAMKIGMLAATSDHWQGMAEVTCLKKR